MGQFEDGKRWHNRNGHGKFVQTAQTLGWSSVAIDNVCADVVCQTRVILLVLGSPFDIEDYICHCGRPIHVYTEAGMEGFSRGMCEPCSEVRCDVVAYVTSDGGGYIPPCPPIDLSAQFRSYLASR